METTYIVTGWYRSGTSMMMQALEAGGLVPVVDQQQEEKLKIYRKKDYDPNPHGYYEPPIGSYFNPTFPKGYEGRLIKILFGHVPKLPVGNYKIVCITRDIKEIEVSYTRMIGKKQPIPYDKYGEELLKAILAIKSRPDCELIVFHYKDVVEDPLLYFKILVGSGWPIDAIAASSKVDPKLYRNRL